jgi:hypothetical protein
LDDGSALPATGGVLVMAVTPLLEPEVGSFHPLLAHSNRWSV